MLTGKLMGHGVATNQRGDQVPYQLIEPARTRENFTEMAREMKRWSRIASLLRGYKPPFLGMDPIQTRASFGEDTIALTAEDVRLGQCCVLMAQAQDGRILGTVEYVVRPDQAGIELLAVDPLNLPGVSGDKGLRGIGTGILAAISRRMLAAGSPRVTLIPFDREAKVFWRHRGFHDCNPPVLCVDGHAEIERLIGSCEVAGDCPDKDECVVCGLETRAMMMRTPEVRAWTALQDAQQRLTKAVGARNRYQLAYVRLPMAERMRHLTSGQYYDGIQPLEHEVDAARDQYRQEVQRVGR